MTIRPPSQRETLCTMAPLCCMRCSVADSAPPPLLPTLALMHAHQGLRHHSQHIRCPQPGSPADQPCVRLTGRQIPSTPSHAQLPWQVHGVQALAHPEDCILAEDIVKQDPSIQSKLREEYGITDMALVACDPWSGAAQLLCLPVFA